MERNGESASKNHYVRRLARITEKKNGGIPPFKGFYNKTAKNQDCSFDFFVLSCEVGAHCVYGKGGALVNRIVNG